MKTSCAQWGCLDHMVSPRHPMHMVHQGRPITVDTRRCTAWTPVEKRFLPQGSLRLKPCRLMLHTWTRMSSVEVGERESYNVEPF